MHLHLDSLKLKNKLASSSKSEPLLSHILINLLEHKASIYYNHLFFVLPGGNMCLLSQPHVIQISLPEENLFEEWKKKNFGRIS